MNVEIDVRTPCRLHFGMFGFGQPNQPQFGGVGVMIEPPGVSVRIRPARVFVVQGSPNRTRQFVERIVASWKLRSWPDCEIICQAPPSHVGLGIGTQLGLAVAAGVRRFLQLPDLSVEELAASVGRGARSAIGTYGFQQGGLIVDGGKERGDVLGKLAARVAMPEAWRFVLVRPAGEQGLAGASETTAFSRLPPVPQEVTSELWKIMNERLIPAAQRQDCAMFGDAVHEFGRLAGECFSVVQGGPFASPEIASLVNSIRELGFRGVGQSSWGPTVFAITSTEDEAQQLAQWLRGRYGAAKHEVIVAGPNNRGATIAG
jgi:beta-RFAP synthase